MQATFVNIGIDRPRTAPPSLAARQAVYRSKSRATSVPLRLLARTGCCQRQTDPGDDRIPLAVLCSRAIHQDADDAAAQLLAVRFDEKINQEFHRAGLI